MSMIVWILKAAGFTFFCLLVIMFLGVILNGGGNKWTRLFK